MQNYGCRRFAALLIKKCSLQSREFVGNGLDRSGIGILTSTLYKIRIEYNTLRLKPKLSLSLLKGITIYKYISIRS